MLAAAGIAYANVRLQAPAEIIQEDGAFYCLDGNGDKKVSCWIDFEGKRYYAGEDGKLCASGISKVEVVDVSFDNGTLIKTRDCVFSSLKDVEGETYYMDPDGILQKDTLINFSEKTYFADPDGKILKNQPVEYQGKNYYAGSDGAFVKNGFTQVGDHYLYINEDSAIAKEPVTLPNGYTIIPDPATGAVSEKEYKISQSEYIYDGNATYIKVNIDSQYMEFVKDGELILSSYIVSGMYNKYDTPRGTYEVLYKSRDVQLKGEIVLDGQYEEVPMTEEEKAKIWDAMTDEEKKDPNAKSKIPTTKKVQKKETWDVTVSYWISFIGGTYGFHDASWRSYFGDYIYTYDGSHGCVNLPTWAAETLYNNVDEGTPVFIL